METFPHNTNSEDMNELGSRALFEHLDKQGNPIVELDYPEIKNGFKHNDELIEITQKINELKKLVPKDNEVQKEIDETLKELNARQKEIIDQSVLFFDQLKNHKQN